VTHSIGDELSDPWLVSPADDKHKADVHVYLPRLSSRRAFFKDSPELIKQRGAEFSAFIKTLLGDGLPPALRRLRSTRVIHDFFGQWEKDFELANRTARSQTVPNFQFTTASLSQPAAAHWEREADLPIIPGRVSMANQGGVASIRSCHPPSVFIPMLPIHRHPSPVDSEVSRLYHSSPSEDGSGTLDSHPTLECVSALLESLKYLAGIQIVQEDELVDR
jgi:hypothetical protein